MAKIAKKKINMFPQASASNRLKTVQLLRADTQNNDKSKRTCITVVSVFKVEKEI